MMDRWTVSQLYETLKKLINTNEKYKDYLIEMEGCDCYGDLGSTMVEEDTKTLILNRTSNPYTRY